MERVFRGGSLVEVGHCRNLLEHAGIRTVIKNEHLASALGDIPFLECQPELWVVNRMDAARARELIAESLSAAPAEGGDQWLCGECGEANEAQFAACWSCGVSDRRP